MNKFCANKRIFNFNLKKLFHINFTRSKSNFQFRQLFDNVTCTYSYLLFDRKSCEGILIDPVFEFVKRDLELIQQLNLKLLYVANTHIHADHITGSGFIKTILPETKSVISEKSCAAADIKVQHNDILKFGDHLLEVRSTPGHTNGCVSYVSHDEKFCLTGDALLIRGCGRTDFQDGDASLLYDSVHSQILSLPANYLLYPAHDYKGKTVTSVAEELKYNPRLTKSKDEFVEIMKNLNLDYPKKIDVSVPANKVCGLYDLPPDLEKLLNEEMKKKFGEV